MSVHDWKHIMAGPEVAILPKNPCHDCAVVNHYYMEFAQRLTQEAPGTVEAVRKRWDCHNALGHARCRGLHNFLESHSSQDKQGD